jgi:hypothetical protein
LAHPVNQWIGRVGLYIKPSEIAKIAESPSLPPMCVARILNFGNLTSDLGRISGLRAK